MTTLLPQEQMISRVRDVCHADARVVAALMYGSFTKGEADAYSDIEFVIYIDDADLATFDAVVWLERIAPVALYFVNEFSVGTAIFENLIRGEFHFDPASSMAQVRTWRNEAGFPDPSAMLILDRTGELITHLAQISGPGPDRTEPATVAWHWHTYLNWILFGAGILARGERARALEILWFVQRCLLRFARLIEGSTDHWQTPSKNVENDLSPETCRRYIACTASLANDALECAYAAAWTWGNELARTLSVTQKLVPNEALLATMDERFTIWLRPNPNRDTVTPGPTHRVRPHLPNHDS